MLSYTFKIKCLINVKKNIFLPTSGCQGLMINHIEYQLGFT